MNKQERTEVAAAIADGKTIEYQNEDGDWFASSLTLAPNRKYRVKPEPPAKAYPETGMTDDELFEVVSSAPSHHAELRMMANAALRHAIDSGTLVLNADYVRVICALGKAVKSLTLAGYTDNGGELWKPPLGKSPDDRPTRDLAIAEAVMSAFVHSRFTITGNDGIDLAEIIATVKE